jgi:lysophospholipase L1-like esterase
MSGLAVYKIVTGDGKKVVYKIGCSEYTFYNGATMDSLLDYNPDRLFIMLGMNSLVDSPGEKVMNRRIGYYKEILQECLKQNPDLQIIVLPVSPTRPSATVKNSCINKYNAKLKEMAEELGVYYYDYTSFLKDSDGNLKSSYSAKDGIHWTKSTYRTFLEKLDSYGETLD